MKPNPKLATLISCVMVLGLAVAQGSSDRRKLGDARSVALPSYAILDESAEPVVASSGKVGFVSSVTAGSLISFSLSSGKVLSSVVVGQTAGPIHLVESGGRRLVAVPAVNRPKEGHPATVSIVDATNAAQLDLKSLLVLPQEAQITQTTRALVTRDGKYCLIASSFDEAALFLFDVETGQVLSRLVLLERPSEMALFEKGRSRVVAVTSAVANSLSVISIHDGELMLTCMFTPSGARLDESNNPAFSADGRTVYIASREADRLFAVDARSGAEFASVSITAPQRVVVARTATGDEIVGVTRIRRPVNGRPGGVTLVSSSGGRLAVKTDFAPPEGIEFSKGNNLVFDTDASAGFIGSDTGILFAFSTETGELESYQQLGRGLHRIALSEKARKLAAVCSTSTGDEIVIVGFDLVTSDEPDPSAPTITALKPDTVEQGRLSSLHLVVKGTNFGEGASLKVNGVDVPAGVLKDGTVLGAKIKRALFDKAGDLSIQVKASNGRISEPASLHILRPSDPMISEIRPREVPGPASAFVLRIFGEKFRDSSVISVGGRELDTEHRGPTELRAQVPSDLVNSIGAVKVQITDMVLKDDLRSNETELTVFGPRIADLLALTDPVAGDGSFNLRISGENFRGGATVLIDGSEMSASRVRRNGNKSIRVKVPRPLTEQAGKLAVVVRNPEGNASEPAELELLAPTISSFDPGQVLAGLSNVKVAVLGTNFRKGLRVYVAGEGPDSARRLERQQVRFRSKGRLVVTFDDDLNKLIAQKGVVKFQIVNPNRTDGVPGPNSDLKVVGPEVTEALIKPVKGDDSHVQLQIMGANFRDQAVVEFFNEADVLLRLRVPARIRDDRIVIFYRSKKVDGLLNQQLRVVNPGDVKSNAVPLKVATDAP